MLERNWPWLVSIAAPAMAATLLVLFAALAPSVLKSSSSATSYRFRSLTDTDLAAATSYPEPLSTNSDVEDDLLRMFYARDLDHSRSLDLSEFVSAADKEPRTKQLALFREIDLDGDGFVSASEYRTQLLAVRGSSPRP